MKKLFIMLAAAATVASCAKESTVMEAPGQAIEFGNVFVDNATRAAAATDPSYSTTGKGVALESFNVYGAVGGVNIFNGNTVTKGVNGYGDAWTLNENDKKYWIEGANYEFVAVVDGNKKVGETVITKTTVDEDSGIPTSIAYNSDGATDLLCARVVRNALNGVTNKEMVAFGFTHLLSKVKFSVQDTSANATNYRFKITEATITGALASNTYNVATGTWGAGSGTKNFSLEKLTVGYGATEYQSTEYHSTELLLLPGSTVTVTVKADIEATDDNGQTWEKVSSVEKTFTNVPTLVQAQAYHFAVKLSVGSEIQFTATAMDDWNTPSTDVPLQ